jgi:hypothetical protein
MKDYTQFYQNCTQPARSVVGNRISEDFVHGSQNPRVPKCKKKKNQVFKSPRLEGLSLLLELESPLTEALKV